MKILSQLIFCVDCDLNLYNCATLLNAKKLSPTMYLLNRFSHFGGAQPYMREGI